ncbi:MAG: histidine phosphotransferase family protein [Alphaproteobacteria bacterium]|nr:histidine phosphotransferase family protein [Alphaproteobacteria bacterium]
MTPVLGDTLDVSLPRLLAARLTHDLSGPIGTMMATAGTSPGAPRSDELLAEAIETMRLRTRLYAAAFGLPDELGWADMTELLAGAPGAHRIVFHIRPPDGVAPPPGALGQLLLVALMLGAEALPRGGSVTLMSAPDAPFMVLPDGAGASWPHGFVDVLAGGAPEAARTPRGLLASWLPALAQAMKCRLSLGMGAGGLSPLLVQSTPH